MKYFTLFFQLLFYVPNLCLGQGEGALNKNLKVFISEKFDSKASITFEYQSKDYDKFGVVDAIKNALVSNGFKVISETSVSPTLEKSEHEEKQDSIKSKKTTVSATSYVKSKYIITMSFKKMALLRGQIVDLSNGSEIVATFSYPGNFDPDILADAIAKKLKGN